MIEINKIHQGDCLDLINKINDESIDLIVCDGPYGITQNSWDKIGGIQEYNLNLIKLFSRILKKGGALYLFGKANCIDFIDYRPYLNLNSKIIWYQPSRLAQGRTNYTNNYDLIAYFSKGKVKTFDLNSIRIPQLVELEHRRRCENVPSVVNGRFHKTKFNDKGKNPGNVWGDIKQLTYKSKELLDRNFLNTIQKPIKLIERIVKANSKENDLVLDPFVGTGTTALVCKNFKRNFIGFEIDSKLVEVCNNRLRDINVELKKEYNLFSVLDNV
ncbi:MAG: site-specific DNA-methyltransferase [Candidatus Staskawiczbacteria bacterium]|nr:site-specific DNA-methyltransferase [Candidatus Staskawiczbacteria bacterium]MBI3337006.1 site-specific DNA-methyltransferase [Candidatus Staskawiczbacteria bacterium]